ISLGDHHALEGLHALALAFDHVHVDEHRVAGLEVRDVPRQTLDLFLLDGLDQIHVQLLLVSLCSFWNSASNRCSSALMPRACSRSSTPSYRPHSKVSALSAASAITLR